MSATVCPRLAVPLVNVRRLKRAAKLIAIEGEEKEPTLGEEKNNKRRQKIK